MRAKKDINKRVGGNIKASREKNNYTQEQLSEMLGVSPNHLSAIERGASGATLEMIEKLSHLLGVSVDYLFFGTQENDSFTTELARKLGSVPVEYRPQVHKVLSALLEALTIQKE